MAPVFKLKIVYPDGAALVFKGAGSFERNMVEAITSEITKTATSALQENIMARGVGWGRTAAHVAKDIEDAVREILPTLVREGTRAALLDLKRETVRAAK